MGDKKELTIFRGQKKWDPPKKAGQYKVRVISSPQPVRFTHFDETGSRSTSTIVIREGDGQTPVFDIKNDTVVDSLSVRQYEPTDFMIVRPLQRNSVTLDLQWGQDKMPIMLPSDFFSHNDPIQIMLGSWKIPPVSGQPVIIEQNSEIADPDHTMAMTEISSDAVSSAGLKEGWNLLENVNESFLKSLCTNLIGGGAGGVVNNFELLRDFFPGQKFYLKQYNGKFYVVFKGLVGTRKFIRGTKYALHNPRVIALSVAKGPGGGVAAAVDGLKPALKGNIIMVVIIGTVDLVAWQQGMLSDDGKFFSDFLVEFGMDLTKAAVSAVVAGFAVGLGCAGAAFIGLTALPVFIVVTTGIVITVIVGMILDYADEELGVSKFIKNNARKVEKSISNAFDEKIVQPISYYLYQLEQNILNLYVGPGALP